MSEGQLRHLGYVGMCFIRSKKPCLVNLEGQKLGLIYKMADETG